MSRMHWRIMFSQRHDYDFLIILRYSIQTTLIISCESGRSSVKIGSTTKQEVYMTEIINVHAREILDSRGNPTVEAEVTAHLGNYRPGGRSFRRFDGRA